MLELNKRRDFVQVATLFEGGLILVALAVGWLFEINPFAKLSGDGTFINEGIGWGIAACVPMYAFFLLSQRYPIGPLKAIQNFLIEVLGGILLKCRWYDLFIVSAMAGIGEEILFRGVLQPLVGLAASNVLFGLAHSITPLYAVLAGLIGVYLGVVFDKTDSLVAPIVAHALYDFLAFLALQRTIRRLPAEPPAVESLPD